MQYKCNKCTYKATHKYDMKTQISFLYPQDVPFFKAAKFTGLGMSLSFTNRQWDLVTKKMENLISYSFLSYWDGNVVMC